MGRLFAPKPVAPAEPAPPPQVASPPASLSRDEVKALIGETMSGVGTQLAGVVNQLSERLDAIASRQSAPVAPVATPSGPPALTDQEIENAIMSGQGAAARIRQLVDNAVTAATDKIVRERVAPLESFGVGAISDLTRRVHLESRPKYQKYKKEIDERINALDPSARARADVIDVIYNAVIGAHADDIAREAEEEAIRKMQAGQQDTPTPTKPRASAPTPGSGAGRQTREQADEIPDAERFAGREGLDALSAAGKGDQDAFAQRMGYKDWADYMKQHEALLRAESVGNA